MKLSDLKEHEYEVEAPAPSKGGLKLSGLSPDQYTHEVPSEPTLGDKIKKYGEDYIVDQLPSLGAAAGGAAGGMTGFFGAGVGAVPGSIAGAGVGGYLGKATQNLYNSYMRPELAPKSDADALLEPLEEGAKGASLEGAGMYAGHVAGNALSPLSQRVSQYLKDKGAIRAFKALYPSKPVAKKAIQTGEAQEIGRELLDSDAIPFFGTPGRIQERLGSLKEGAGEEVGRLIDQADARVAEHTPIEFTHPEVEYTPVKFKKPRGKDLIVNQEVRATPISFEENPSKRAFPWLPDSDVPPLLTRGEEQAVQHEMIDPRTRVIPGEVKSIPGRKTVVSQSGPIRSEPARGMTVDMEKIAQSVLSSPEYKKLETQYGTKSARNALDEYLGTIGSKGEVNLRSAQGLRQDVDAGINFGKRSDDLSPAQGVLYQTRNKIRDAMNAVTNSLEGESKDALLNANRRYGRLESASDILEGKTAADLANKDISLTDSISGAAGYAKGGKTGAAIAAGANKLGRTFGRSMSAVSYNTLSKVLRSSPEALGKYAAPLLQAESRGTDSLRLMDQILRSDPEYLMQLKFATQGSDADRDPAEERE